MKLLSDLSFLILCISVPDSKESKSKRSETKSENCPTSSFHVDQGIIGASMYSLTFFSSYLFKSNAGKKIRGKTCKNYFSLLVYLVWSC